MDAGAVTGPGDLEMALGNARDQREDMVLWLALQVMMTDNVALAYERTGERRAALRHWTNYIKLDPIGPWSNHARMQARKILEREKLSIVHHGSSARHEFHSRRARSVPSLLSIAKPQLPM